MKIKYPIIFFIGMAVINYGSYQLGKSHAFKKGVMI